MENNKDNHCGISSSRSSIQGMIHTAKKYVSMAMTAYFTEEKESNILSLEDCIRWVTDNYDKEKYRGACIFRNVNDVDRISITVCLTDKAGNPLMNRNDHVLFVTCAGISIDLEQAFGNKNMVILG